ncbi:MAG: hypothetical protein QOI64_1532 [Solirubrobacteraceae bacterium]|nr:hypothetical protein [Solirubrobacteraceae bacterium]
MIGVPPIVPAQARIRLPRSIIGPMASNAPSSPPASQDRRRGTSDRSRATADQPDGAKELVRLRSLRGDYYVPHYDLWKRRHFTRAIADVLPPGGRVLVLGSCFAEEIVEYLNRRGYNADTHPAGELYNPFSLRTELEHVITADAWPFDIALQTPEGVEHRLRKHCRAGTREELETLDAQITERVRASIAEADLLLIIAGTTTEVWRHAPSGLPTNMIPHPDVFRRGGWELDPGDLGDLCAEVERTQELLSQATDAPQVYAVCPIPLYATWLDTPVTAANGRSKALLRTALELSLKDDALYLDMWDWVHAQAGRRVPVQADGRHFTATGLDQIMLFTERRLCARPVPRLSVSHRAHSRVIDVRQRARHWKVSRGARRLARILGRQPSS